MYRARRRHPLQTFRFWFLVLGTVTVTAAWRLDMLPIRFGPAEAGRRFEESFTEVELPHAADWDEPVRQIEESPRLSSPPAQVQVASAPPERHADSIFADAPMTAGNLEQASNEPVDRHFLPQTETTQPYTRSAERRRPALTGDHAAEAAGTAIIQASGTGNPFAIEQAAAEIPAEAPLNTQLVDFTEIDRLSQSNSPQDHIEAHRELSTMYWQQPELRGELRTRIDALAQRIYFQAQPHYMPAYEVAPGDMLQKVGKKYDVTWQYLAKLNQVDPQQIRGGQRLKVIKGPFSAIIDLSDYELTIHAHGYYVTRYPVGIGRDGSTPIGTFVVQNKEVDPTYYGPDGVVAHDDPANPLGERWIDIGNSYGIHGTIDPGSIGRNESRGCVRMLNEDVAAVFDLLIVGSEITIRE